MARRSCALVAPGSVLSGRAGLVRPGGRTVKRTAGQDRPRPPWLVATGPHVAFHGDNGTGLPRKNESARQEAVSSDREGRSAAGYGSSSTRSAVNAEEPWWFSTVPWMM